MNRTWLYRAEAKGIQSWILASDRLRELKGGSALVDGLPGQAERLLAGIGGGEMVTAAAGGVEIRFLQESALQRFASAWPAIVEQLAPGLTLVHAWVQEGGADPYPALYTALGAARNRAWPSLPVAGPLSARSARTGLPAEARDKQGGLLDAATRAKEAAAEGHGALDDLAPTGWAFTVETSEIGDPYVAVVHADGNAVGKRVAGLSADLRKGFSEALGAATKRAARDAVAQLVRLQAAEGRKTRTLRGRPIVLGGDDLTFLVDAAFALPFVDAYLRAFEHHTQEVGRVDGKGPLTACAGVAFVKSGFPFHAAHELAESLCKGAKEGLRADGRPRSGLLFHRVTTASPDTDWHELLRGELAAAPDADGLRPTLAGGPYDLDGLGLLRQLATRLKDVPKKSVREWLTLARTDLGRAEARWKRAREVMGERTATPDPALAELDAALTALNHAPADGWSSGPPRRTCLADALTWLSIDSGLALSEALA